jgi:site-specific recombinase XerD
MNINNLNIYFYVRESSVNGKRGTFYVRVTINSEQIVCSVRGLSMYSKEFNSKTQNPTPKCDLYHECNEFMIGIRRELNRVHYDFEQKYQVFTKDHLIKAVEAVYFRVKHGHQQRAKAFKQLFADFLADQHKRIGIDIAKGTYKVRERYGKVFQDAIEANEIFHMPVCNFTEKEIIKIQDYLKCKYSVGYSARIFPVLSMVFDFALKRHETSLNPCKLVEKIKRGGEMNPIWLEHEETLKLKSLELTGAEKRYRDAFLFCCFTGLSIGDYELLNPRRAGYLIDVANSPRNIVAGKLISYSFGDFLEGRRRKTGTKYRIPLPLEAKELIDEYGGIENMPFVLKNSSAILNLLMAAAGIKKRIKFHTARKTMANYLINVKMMNPYHVVSVMGWRRIEEAAPYTVVSNETLKRQIEAI